MPKQAISAEKTTTKQQTKPQPTVESMTGTAEIGGEPLWSNGKALQANLVDNPQLPRLQRQLLAMQIGESYGNGHLQQMMSMSKRKQCDVLYRQNKYVQSASQMFLRPSRTLAKPAIQSTCACGNHTMKGTECSDCRKKKVQTSGERWNIDRGLMRQTTQSPAKSIGVFTYDRANFGGRFDGEVDAENHRVTLIMHLGINDMVGGSDRITDFFVKAKAAIEGAWRNTAFALKSNCAADLYSVAVIVLLNDTNPHQVVTLWPAQGERSSENNWQENDTKPMTRDTTVILDKSKPPTAKGNTAEVQFTQIPVVHEFGHLMGLKHPICDDPKRDICYGMTYEEKSDLMGYGSDITQRDFEPFIRITRCYGQDHLPKGCNIWRVVPF